MDVTHFDDFPADADTDSRPQTDDDHHTGCVRYRNSWKRDLRRGMSETYQ